VRKKLIGLQLVLVGFVSILAFAGCSGEKPETSSTPAHPAGEALDPDSFPEVWLEIFPVYLDGESILALVPEEGKSWRFPMLKSASGHRQVQLEMTESGIQPLMIHSTSWRQEGEDLVLTYLAVIRPPSIPPRNFKAVAAEPRGLVRGEALAPPPEIPFSSVLHHALQHLAWLLRTDTKIREALPVSWENALEPFRPEPARSLDNAPSWS